jgi:pyrimidine deaminase RibD-like protein
MDTRRKFFSKNCLNYMRAAPLLAQRGYGTASPNPMVGAVLVKRGKVAK